MSWRNELSSATSMWEPRLYRSASYRDGSGYTGSSEPEGGLTGPGGADYGDRTIVVRMPDPALEERIRHLEMQLANEKALRGVTPQRQEEQPVERDEVETVVNNIVGEIGKRPTTVSLALGVLSALVVGSALKSQKDGKPMVESMETDAKENVKKIADGLADFMNRHPIVGALLIVFFVTIFGRKIIKAVTKETN